jgi:hypothetical protein
MNEIEFEAKLRADGYTEIETQKLEPRPAKGEHGHRSRSAGSFSRARSSSLRTISEQYTSPGKFLRSRRDTRTMSPSVLKALAFSLVASLQNRRREIKKFGGISAMGEGKYGGCRASSSARAGPARRVVGDAECLRCLDDASQPAAAAHQEY